MTADIESFQQHRPALLALAYRMLGEVARAEDVVQDAWVRWQQTDMGATKVAAFIAAVAPQGASDLVIQECELNGLPGMLVLRNGSPYTAILLSVRDNSINAIFMHADAARLGHVGTPR